MHILLSLVRLCKETKIVDKILQFIIAKVFIITRY